MFAQICLIPSHLVYFGHLSSSLVHPLSMAPKRIRPDAWQYPGLPVAFKKLREHGCFNGQRIPPSDGPFGHPGYYKAQGVTPHVAELCANYLFHTTVEDRRWWLDLLCTGSQTSPTNAAKVIVCYKNIVNIKSREHKLLVERGGVIVMDATSRMH